MVKKWLIGCLFLLNVSVIFNTSLAQEGSDPLSGYWKQEGASVYIQVVNSDGVYQAEMVRNDWSPGLVGTIFFQNVVSTGKKKNRWAGETQEAGSGRIGKASLRISRSGKLTSRLRPGGSVTWTRSEPIEKRY